MLTSFISHHLTYSKYHRNLLKRENSGLSFGDLGKTVGAMWKAASAEERQPFEEQAAHDKVRFAKQAEAYKLTSAGAAQEGAKLPKLPDGPSGAASAELEGAPADGGDEGGVLDDDLADITAEEGALGDLQDPSDDDDEGAEVDE